MRVVAEIPHPQFKITIFSWNEKYLIKLEAGPFEQTYKIAALDLTSEDEVKAILNEEFLDSATQIFLQMRKSFGKALSEFL